MPTTSTYNNNTGTFTFTFTIGDDLLTPIGGSSNYKYTYKSTLPSGGNITGATIVLFNPSNTHITSIDAGAFRNFTALTSISIPTSVTSIGANAFQGCTALAEIIIPTNVTNIGVDAFQGCTALASVIFNSKPTLGSNAFTGIIGSSIGTSLTYYTSNGDLISLKTAGFTASQLKAAGFTASQLKAAGFTASQLKDALFTASQLKDAKYSDADILAVNKASYDDVGSGGGNNYATKLTTYKQKYADYLAALKNGSHELKLSVAGKQYSGGIIIDNQYALNSGECIALCSRTNTCTGATFNSDQNSCNLSSGPGHSANVSDSASYAIISDIQDKLYDFNVAAKALSTANQAVETDLNSGDATVFNAKTGKLQTIYTDLLQDRQNIDEATQQFNKLNNTNINASIGITASSNQYIIWIVFAILVLSTTFMIFFVPNVNIMETYPAISLFIILIIMYFAFSYIQNIQISFPNLSYYFNSINYYN